MMKHMIAILWKQIKDTFKNKTIFIQFVMFPALTIIMENAVKMEGMEEHFFATLFAVMYMGMAPLTSMAAIISEEKEKNTLRVLRMSNVKPAEYLMGVGIYIWTICMIGAGVIGIAGKYTGSVFGKFMCVMGVGMLVSILIGAAIGTWSRNQMMATSITVPVMMVFSFLPMLAMFNDSIAKIAKFTYSQQIHLLINQLEQMEIKFEQTGVVLINMVVAVVLFVFAYKRTGLE
ncbi:MAG: ABC transporter permease [Lachnospiraceae bacterium]|nr:ABC transporter permease [Lachnospiraceae bacterium]